MVALVLLAVALLALGRASAVAVDGAAEFKERILATWVVQNRMAEYAIGAIPSAGVRRGRSEQAGMEFEWEESITPTVLFRDYLRVEVRVFGKRRPDYVLARIVTYAANFHTVRSVAEGQIPSSGRF